MAEASIRRSECSRERARGTRAALLRFFWPKDVQLCFSLALPVAVRRFARERWECRRREKMYAKAMAIIIVLIKIITIRA